MPLDRPRSSYTVETWAKRSTTQRTVELPHSYIESLGGRSSFWHAIGPHNAYTAWEATDNGVHAHGCPAITGGGAVRSLDVLLIVDKTIDALPKAAESSTERLARSVARANIPLRGLA